MRIEECISVWKWSLEVHLPILSTKYAFHSSLTCWKKVCTVHCFLDEVPLSRNCCLQKFVCWTYFLLESTTLSMFSYTADNKTLAFFGWRDSLIGDSLTRVHDRWFTHTCVSHQEGEVCVRKNKEGAKNINQLKLLIPMASVVWCWLRERIFLRTVKTSFETPHVCLPSLAHSWWSGWG